MNCLVPPIVDIITGSILVFVAIKLLEYFVAKKVDEVIAVSIILSLTLLVSAIVTLLMHIGGLL